METKKLYEKINIVYEDNHLLIVVKPHNMPTQSDSSNDPDLLSTMKEYLVDTYQKEGEAFLGMVHRLDRPTGGIIVFAKTSKAAARLSESIKNGSFEKKYFAVVEGEPNPPHATLTHYLLKNEARNVVQTVPLATVGAKKAITEYKTLIGGEDMSLLEVTIPTGRGHQIRVQLTANKNPLIGDQKYGDDFCKKEKCPLALWAYEIRFEHPTTKQIMVFRVAPDTKRYPWNKFNVEQYIEVDICN